MIYLTEKILGEFLSDRFGNVEIISNKAYFKDYGHRFRPDFVIPSLKLVVEYDGDDHFTNNKVISDDLKKQTLIESLGYSLIRIPYFLQLDINVEKLYFGNFEKHYTRTTSRKDFSFGFPNGFITEKCIMPGKFTELGLDRFESVLHRLIADTDNGDKTVCEVYESLFRKLIVNDRPLLDCFPRFFHPNPTMMNMSDIDYVASYWSKEKIQIPQSKIDEARRLIEFTKKK